MCAVYEYATARAYVTRTGGTGKTYTIYRRYRSPHADDENVPLQSRFLLCRKMNVSNCALIDWNQTDMDSYNDRKGLQGVRRLFFWVFWIFWTKIDLGANRFELPR